MAQGVGLLLDGSSIPSVDRMLDEACCGLRISYSENITEFRHKGTENLTLAFT